MKGENSVERVTRMIKDVDWTCLSTSFKGLEIARFSAPYIFASLNLLAL